MQIVPEYLDREWYSRSIIWDDKIEYFNMETWETLVTDIYVAIWLDKDTWEEHISNFLTDKIPQNISKESQ